MGDARARRQVGRYLLFDEIAAGGMATVHFGRLVGAEGFSRTVAIKRLHPQYAKDPEFVAMFLDEARLVARIRHPNVVPTLDIVSDEGEMLLVMEYVPGASLTRLTRNLRREGEGLPSGVAAAVVAGALAGLHAAHEAVSEQGTPLDLVHRDVSPQNLLLGVDGVTRVIDFGIAKAVGRLQTTEEGQVKGKTRYLSPEQVRGRPVDRRADVYAAGVVLWEALTGAQLFAGDTPIAIMNQVLEKPVARPSTIARDVPAELDAVVLKALSRNRDARWASANEMIVALEQAIALPSSREIGEWVASIAGDTLRATAERVREIEASSPTGMTSGVRPVVLDDVVEAADLRGEPVTTEAHISEVSEPPRAGRRRAIALGALIVIGAAGFVVGRRGSAVPASPAVEPPPPAAARGSPGVDPATSASDAAALPSSDAHALTPPPAAPPHAPQPARRAPPSRTRARCTPPYTVDPSGGRHWIEGC